MRRNNLTSVSGTGISVALDYDAKGRLAEENSANGIVQFAYAGTALIAEYDSSNTLLRRYVHGPGSDEPIAVYEGSGTASKFYMMADHQGSIIGYTDSAGTVTDKNSYSPEGVPDAANVGRFGYTGQMWLAEAELYHYKARAYDPQLGRFLQADPIGYGDGLNMYAYVGGDAVNRRDPSGLSKCDPGEDCITVTSPRIRPSVMILIRRLVSYRLVGSFFGGGGGGGGGRAGPGGDTGDGEVQTTQCPEYDAADNVSRGFLDRGTGGDVTLGRRGILGTGARLIGPFSSYDDAVQSALRPFSGGTSRNNQTIEGMTIFSGSSGYYRSRISAPGFNQGNQFFPTNGGWFSRLSPVSTVSSIRNDGQFIDPGIGSESIQLDRRGNGRFVGRCSTQD